MELDTIKAMGGESRMQRKWEDSTSFLAHVGAQLRRVGSGKSTLQKLAMGLFQPTSGSIMIDGIDLRQLDPCEFRSRVGYVPQDVTLFYGSLRDKFTLSSADVSDDAIFAEQTGSSDR